MLYLRVIIAKLGMRKGKYEMLGLHWRLCLVFICVHAKGSEPMTVTSMTCYASFGLTYRYMHAFFPIESKYSSVYTINRRNPQSPKHPAYQWLNPIKALHTNLLYFNDSVLVSLNGYIRKRHVTSLASVLSRQQQNANIFKHIQFHA